jgi:hypothetical protein
MSARVLGRSALLATAIAGLTARSARSWPEDPARDRACAQRPGAPLDGPCTVVDTLTALLPPRGAGTPTAATPVLMSNFGLIVPGAAAAQSYAFACEDVLGAVATDFVTMDAAGGVLVPGLGGLRLATPEGALGCGYRNAPAPLLGRAVVAVAPDPNDARRIWALVGDKTRELHRSDDAGGSFQPVTTFPTALRLWKLAVAPSDSRVLYVAGYSGGDPNASPPLAAAGLVLAVSHDAGASFETILPAAGFADSRWIVFLGIAPEDPRTVFLIRAAGSDGGDELWRSTDGGRTATKVLTLPIGHTYAGFAFGDAPGLTFVAGRPALQTEADNSAELYVSRDGGTTWSAPISSGSAGPRYRCLAARGGHLYACGGGSDAGDGFLLGQSDDEGRTWQPLITTAQIRGPVACGRAACASTTSWLCDFYDICGGEADGGAVLPGSRDAANPGRADAGSSSDAAVDRPQASDGCSCGLGAGPPRDASSTPLTTLSMIALVMLVRRHVRRRPR